MVLLIVLFFNIGDTHCTLSTYCSTQKKVKSNQTIIFRSITCEMKLTFLKIQI